MLTDTRVLEVILQASLIMHPTPACTCYVLKQKMAVHVSQRVVQSQLVIDIVKHVHNMQMITIQSVSGHWR